MKQTINKEKNAAFYSNHQEHSFNIFCNMKPHTQIIHIQPVLYFYHYLFLSFIITIYIPFIYLSIIIIFFIFYYYSFSLSIFTIYINYSFLLFLYLFLIYFCYLFLLSLFIIHFQSSVTVKYQYLRPLFGQNKTALTPR